MPNDNGFLIVYVFTEMHLIENLPFFQSNVSLSKVSTNFRPKVLVRNAHYQKCTIIGPALYFNSWRTEYIFFNKLKIKNIFLLFLNVFLLWKFCIIIYINKVESYFLFQF
ncbi:unnamed protein product [Blepharisma stoltei]|uniref:Uncharacterized protein n=1 Tax=Blepharisma stoltei TaxID=1481888 RepID=A0AAU9JHY6_9CILI|nr:unnamed protein product [Blepharisma stoltei]